MSGVPAQKLREIVLQILYSIGIGSADREALETLLSHELGISQTTVSTAYDRALIVVKGLEQIDEDITSASQAYDPVRIPTVELNILRLGVFEMLYDGSIPPKVAIAEAVRLARKFSSPEAAAFVNAVLDCLYKKSEGVVSDQLELEQRVEDLKKAQELAHEASQEQPPSEE